MLVIHDYKPFEESKYIFTEDLRYFLLVIKNRRSS